MAKVTHAIEAFRHGRVCRLGGGRFAVIPAGDRGCPAARTWAKPLSLAGLAPGQDRGGRFRARGTRAGGRPDITAANLP